MKTLICIISIFLICTSASMATDTSSEKTSVVAPTITAQYISQADLELKVLQTQNATMKEYHSSLLDTVYWTLATVATIAVLLVGFGWFTNFKFHDAEKQRLKEELDARLKEATTTLEVKFGSHKDDIAKLIDSRLDAFFTRITRDIDIARAEATRYEKENDDAIVQLRAVVQTLQEDQKKNLIADNNIEASLRLVEEKIWDLKGIPFNILLTQSQGLKAAIKAENRTYIVSTLERMQLTIKTIISSNKEIGKNTLDLIELALSEAEVTEPIAVSNVRELLKQIPVKDEQPA
jgi:hypothetical protein